MDMYITKIFFGTYHVLSSIPVFIRDSSGTPQQYQWVIYFMSISNNLSFYSGLINGGGGFVKGAYTALGSLNMEGWQKFRFTIQNTMPPLPPVDYFEIEYYDSDGNINYENMTTTTLSMPIIFTENNIGCFTYSGSVKLYHMIGMLRYL
jgi:hypothetical protein